MRTFAAIRTMMFAITLALSAPGAAIANVTLYISDGSVILYDFQGYPYGIGGRITVNTSAGLISSADIFVEETFDSIINQFSSGPDYTLLLQSSRFNDGCAPAPDCHDTMSIEFSADPATLALNGGTIVGGSGFFEDCPCYFNDTSGTLVFGAVPEPATWTMLLIGFAGLGVVHVGGGRHRRRALRLA